jgi:hypothetical protein
MATLASLRTIANVYLARTNGDTLPWTDTDIDTLMGIALARLWPRIGKRASGTVATSSTTDTYTLPAGVTRVSRVELLNTDGTVADRITNWRYISDTQVVISPMLASGYTLRFIGWAAYSATGSDLPSNLEGVIAMRAAGLAYGELAGRLANSQRQQTLDSGRIVDYSTAVGLSAYWERRAVDELGADPQAVSYAPRYAHR